MAPAKKDETADLLSDIESITSVASSTTPRIPRFLNIRSANLFLATLWILSFFYFQATSYSDPSSVFFREEEAYRPIYSAVREEEADTYIAALEERWHLEPFIPYMNSGLPQYCIGIPSKRREREQFLPRTLASLVDSLKTRERRAVHIVVLLSDDEVTDNAAYGQWWLHAMADTILVRQESSATSSLPQGGHYRRIPPLPASTDRIQHMLLDQAALLKACGELNAEYVMLIEDDVIASRDWFARVVGALPRVEDAASKKGADWLYLRLFYSETYLGWNSEEWPVYMRYITLVYLAVGIVLLLVRRLYVHHSSSPLSSKDRSQTPSCTRIISSRTLLPYALLLIWMPLFTSLYFMAGRLTVQPLSKGIHEMPRYGCCAQGLVVPHRHVAKLKAAVVNNKYGLPTDSSVDAFAEELGLEQWALVPSVLQHVGVRGSSAAGGVRKLTWNFRFERVYA